jgi:hypothetical protein
MLTSILYTQNKIKNLKSFKYWSKNMGLTNAGSCLSKSFIPNG